MDSVQGSNLATFLRDLSQSEILSEIEPPLKVACFQKFDGAQKNMPNHYLKLECLKFSQAEKVRTAAKQ